MMLLTCFFMERSKARPSIILFFWEFNKILRIFLSDFIEVKISLRKSLLQIPQDQ